MKKNEQREIRPDRITWVPNMSSMCADIEQASFLERAEFKLSLISQFINASFLALAASFSSQGTTSHSVRIIKWWLQASTLKPLVLVLFYNSIVSLSFLSFWIQTFANKSIYKWIFFTHFLKSKNVSSRSIFLKFMALCTVRISN